MKAIRSKLALILFGMILGAFSYGGIYSRVIDRAPVVSQEPTSGTGTGPVKWENDTVAPVTKILPSAPGKATITDGVGFSGGPYQPRTKDARARIRVIAYASSAEPNEAVIAVFLSGGKSPLALASKPTDNGKREKIETRDQPQDREGTRRQNLRQSSVARRRGDRMKRRAFITLLGGAAAWPLAARAQQPERVRRIGVLHTPAADDPDGQARNVAFLQGLQQLGWTDGRNVRIDLRWTAGDPELTRKYTAELVALAPDVILASGSATVGPLLQATRAVPIVFVNVPDPVGAGFVDSLARPGGNATGFILFEYGLSGKWLELLKQIVPGLTRVAVIRDPAITAGIGQFGAIQAVAPSLGVEVSPVNVRDAGEIERTVTAFARSANGGLIVTGSALAVVHRDLIITLAARHKLPAVYFRPLFVSDGGLIAYGPNIIDQYRRAAGYVDRILKGEKPADLPVQAPTKYELVINLKTAKALGIEIPATVLARADEVIE